MMTPSPLSTQKVVKACGVADNSGSIVQTCLERSLQDVPPCNEASKGTLNSDPALTKVAVVTALGGIILVVVRVWRKKMLCASAGIAAHHMGR